MYALSIQGHSVKCWGSIDHHNPLDYCSALQKLTLSKEVKRLRSLKARELKFKILGPLFTICVTLDNLFNLSLSWFPHLYYEGNDSTHFIGIIYDD